ncbi:MAG TPA: hypothetical protein VFR78_20525 [Pyrinomonadaceae bacterium]|nr:hypothetical protein [Pyrinomonadaceae bacterium]
MTVRVKTKGRIIRILDSKTVIINLGSEHGVTGTSIFHILADPEDVVDPETNEVLGSVKVTKGRVRALQVSEKFTIATSSWTESVINPLLNFISTHRQTVEETLKIDARELKPWKGKSEVPIRVGDEVEVLVEIDEPGEEEPEGYDEADDEDLEANFHDGSQTNVSDET